MEDQYSTRVSILCNFDTFLFFIYSVKVEVAQWNKPVIPVTQEMETKRQLDPGVQGQPWLHSENII